MCNKHTQTEIIIFIIKGSEGILEFHTEIGLFAEYGPHFTTKGHLTLNMIYNFSYLSLKCRASEDFFTESHL